MDSNDSPEMPIPTAAHLRLRALRTWRGLTKQELGDAIGRSRSQVSLWEKGRHRPDPEIAVRLAVFFGPELLPAELWYREEAA